MRSSKVIRRAINDENTVMSVKAGDHIKFGEGNLLAGKVISLGRTSATVKIGEWQTAVVGLSAILIVNSRRVGESKLAVA